MNFIKFHSKKNFIISGVCLSGVCLVRSLSFRSLSFRSLSFRSLSFRSLSSTPRKAPLPNPGREGALNEPEGLRIAYREYLRTSGNIENIEEQLHA